MTDKIEKSDKTKNINERKPYKEEKMKEKDVKKIVREKYASVAKRVSPSCCSAQSCCGSTERVQTVNENMGYTEQEIKAVPEGANLGLGCGNPTAIASLQEGETVLDLGSGAGFDCFLAAQKVGKKGKVIGVDMTPEMIDKARENAQKGNYPQVEFRLGEIEHLPAADNSVDVVISNCVINLAPDKKQVLKEAYRVLKPGGRLSISDLALRRQLPAKIRENVEAYVGCIAGAVLIDEYKRFVKEAGFNDIKFTVNNASSSDDADARARAEKALSLKPEEYDSLDAAVASIYIEARK